MSIPENPINPTEQYLARLAGQNAQLPDHPITRTHQYLEALVGTAGKLEADFNGEIFGGTVALTERVDGGTHLKNQFWLNKAVAVVGFCYGGEAGRIGFYGIFATPDTPPNLKKSYFIAIKDSPDPARELTLADTEYVHEIPGTTDIYKYRVHAGNLTDHVDFRLAREIYKEDGTLDYVIYSEQYRYTIDGETVTRTRTNTAPQDPTYIIDLGLMVQYNTVGRTFGVLHSATTRAVLPLVSTEQTYEYEWIIPDSFFDNAPLGLAVCAVMGDQVRALGPTFDKAEDTGPFVVTLTPTGLDFSGTMDKTGDDILQAYLSGRRIRFDVPALSSSMDATMFNFEYDGAGGIAGVMASAFVAFNAGSGWMNILVSSDPDDNTYTTIIFQLTPIT